MSGQVRRDSSFTATILALLMVVTSLSPLAMAEDIADDDLEGFVGNLSEFDPITEGKEYLLSEILFDFDTDLKILQNLLGYQPLRVYFHLNLSLPFGHLLVPLTKNL